MKRVLVSGALGKMGTEVIKAIGQASDLEVVCGVDPKAEKDADGIRYYQELAPAIKATNPDVVVDFTHPGVVLENIKICLEHGVRAVVGTTGLTAEDVERLEHEAAKPDWAALIAPNFAIGAVLMMKFAQEAARYFPNVEIIEYHHNQKKDAPSGTAIKTAEMINQVLTGEAENNPDEFEKLPGARGAASSAVQIHSVRLPGYVAHQEVIFSSAGQLLTIKHDSTHRESFMPGVLLAVRKIDQLEGIIYGLEHIL
jgi:4-hydroxy-tetrahydrodipicolinate reductase